MEAIILAAGRGSRMGPLCTKRPKPMLPLGGTPILDHLLRRLHRAGITHAVIVVEYLAEVIESELEIPLGMAVKYVRQGQPRGTGHAVACGAGHTRGEVLVVMGDSLVAESTIKALVQGSGLLVAAARVSNPENYGVLVVKGDEILGLEEKPSQPRSDLANTAFYRVPRGILDQAQHLKPSPRGELEFTDLIHTAAKENQAKWILASEWIDIGNPWQYLSAHETYFRGLTSENHTLGDILGEVEPGVHIRGTITVERGAIIKSGTYIEGDVLIRRGAVIGPNAYIRGPVEIGPNCKVGAASEIKNSILLEGAKAPHHNYVGDSVMGHDTNIGSGTKLANVKHGSRTIRVEWNGNLIDTGRQKFGAVLGDGAKTGVNASLNPGTILAPFFRLPAGATASGWVVQN